MEEYNNGLREEKPKKKFSCTFSPSLLPMDIRIKLHKEGKVPIMQFQTGTAAFYSQIESHVYMSELRLPSICHGAAGFNMPEENKDCAIVFAFS